MFNFLLSLFQKFVVGLSKFVCKIFSGFPVIPSVVVALDTLDLVTEAVIACNYFLPMDTIAFILSSSIIWYALKIVIIFMKSDLGHSLAKLVVGKLNSLAGIFFDLISKIK